MINDEFNNKIINLENKVDSLLALLKNSSLLAPVCICEYTLHSWLDEWLRVFKAPSIKPVSLYALDVAVRVHIKPNLPDIPLNLITGLELQKFFVKIEKSRTRKTVFDVLKGSFRDAYNLKLIMENPMQVVKIPLHRRRQGNPLTSTDVLTFKKAIKKHPLKNLFLFLLYTGCRRNEAITLNIADVDFKNKVLHIRGTKTKLSNRSIPLFANVSDLLVKIKPTKDGFYFPFRPDYATHAFKKLCPSHKLHDLRHTFATECLKARIPLKVVQIWLGHSEIDTTADIYSHVTEEINIAEANVLNAYNKQKTL